MTKVSILIPCYNAEKWIAQAIQSALDQTYDQKEVIVVDDGSTDNSLDIIQTFDGMSSCFRWETGENRGGNEARNRLLELSTGEWVQYLDADDYLLPNKVQEQVTFLRSHLEADVIYSFHITEELESGKTVLRNPSKEVMTEAADLWLRAIQWKLPQTGGLLIKKNALLDINGWKEGLKHCQDYDLYIRLLAADKKFVFCPASGAVYRWWCSGTVTHRKIAEIYKDRLGVQQNIEEYLNKRSELSTEREAALEQAKFEYARRVYTWDKPWARRIAKEIKNKNRNFTPSLQIVPRLYQILYKFLGFNTAESIAALKRKIEKQSKYRTKVE